MEWSVKPDWPVLQAHYRWFESPQLGWLAFKKDPYWKAEKILAGREFHENTRFMLNLAKVLVSGLAQPILSEPNTYLGIISNRWYSRF